MIIDTHAHITCDRLFQRFDEIKQNASDADVKHILIVCTGFEEAKRAIELAKEDKMFDVAFGIHPCDLNEMNEEKWEQLKKILDEKEVIALGEIGLDYHWDTVEKDIQKQGFIRQLQIANEKNLPVIIHMREATKDTLEILNEYAKTKVLMHCYSGSVETARELWKKGVYTSFAGPITFKNSRGLNDVVKEAPIDKIFVETDCPYLTPHPYRGSENEPKYARLNFVKLCELKEMNEADVALQMVKNYETFFNKKLNTEE